MKVFSLAVVCVLILVSVSGGTQMEMHGQLGELDRAMNLKLNTRRERGKSKFTFSQKKAVKSKSINHQTINCIL